MPRFYEDGPAMGPGERTMMAYCVLQVFIHEKVKTAPLRIVDMKARSHIKLDDDRDLPYYDNRVAAGAWCDMQNQMEMAKGNEIGASRYRWEPYVLVLP